MGEMFVIAISPDTSLNECVQTGFVKYLFFFKLDAYLYKNMNNARTFMFVLNARQTITGVTTT